MSYQSDPGRLRGSVTVALIRMVALIEMVNMAQD